MSKLKKFLAICTASVAAALVALPSQACFSPFGFGFGLGCPFGFGFGLGCPFGLGFGGLGFSSFSSFAVSSFSSFGFGFSPFWW